LPKKYDAILVLDFGGQYCHLISRRIRELKVYSEVVPHDISLEELKEKNKQLKIKGLIFSGGPFSVYEENSPKCNPEILNTNLPILGICYGHQLIAFMFGGDVVRGEKAEYGVCNVKILKPVDVLENLSQVEKVWMSHRDIVSSIPEEFEILAKTENTPIAAFRHKNLPIYGVQWHPEVVHTENGLKILENFVVKICKCKANWRMKNFITKAVKEIKEEVGESKAIIALSGGIDSSTAAVLAAKALGDRLLAVFIDHGFMRENEIEYIKKTFSNRLNLRIVNAREEFMKNLKGIRDPELKRKIIGETFIRVFEKVAKEFGADFLIQGTIYPDRIESGFRKYSDKIKTHHNVAGIPAKLDFKGIIEPLRNLYKDEVREIAKLLCLPEEVVKRQPFPGPGLAVRIIGEITPEKIRIVKKADKIVREEIEKIGLNAKLWQYFAVLLDTMSTGVKGDRRAYGYTIAVRAVESKEAMTARFAKIPYEVLEKISTRITNEIPEVARVVYDITHKPPATIEWE